MTKHATWIVAAAVLAAPAVAQAEWHYTKSGAEKIAREDAADRYGHYGITYRGAVSSCRPQGQSHDPRFKYHRWVCAWAGLDDSLARCSGSLVIKGSADAGAYYSRVLRGMRCYDE